MAFGLPGNVGQIAEESIAKIIARQQLEQEMARRAQMDQAQLVLDQQAQQQRVVEHGDQVRGQEADRAFRAQSERTRSNQFGLEQMGRDRSVMDTETDERALDELVAGMPEGVGRRVVNLRRRGVNVPAADVMTPDERKTDDAADITRAGSIAEAQAKGAAKYRAPSEPNEKTRTWVLRAGKPVRVTEAEIQPGDAPFSSGGESAQDRQRGARMTAAKGFLDRLNTLREGINTKMGPQAGLTGIVRRGAANIGMDPDVAEYERERAAAGRALAVAIMGAQNLSDQDANAWSNMLPDARVDKETAQRLMDQVGTMLDGMGGAPPAEGVGGDSAYQRYLKRQRGGQ